MNLTTPTPAKKKRRVWLWLLALIGVAFGYAGWRAYYVHTGLKEAQREAEALGWQVWYTAPYEFIRAKWSHAFKKKTWPDGVALVAVPDSDVLIQHPKLLQRLNPKSIRIDNAISLRDFSMLQGLHRLDGLYVSEFKNLTNLDVLQSLPALKYVSLYYCDQLLNVDGFQHLTALEAVVLQHCPRLANLDGLKALPKLKRLTVHSFPELKNVDVLKNLPALEILFITDCPGVTAESIEALKAAHPNAQIFTEWPVPPKK